MADLATASKAPAGGGVIPIMPVSNTPAPAATTPLPSGGEPLLTFEGSQKCTNCKTCYQELPELFEKTRIVVNGESREVAQLIPGALERVVATPELKSRIRRVSANCDAEIIR